jgi:hypothetical protein
MASAIAYARENGFAAVTCGHTHFALDLLLTHQWQQLLEIQRVQADLIQDAMRRRNE